jgi:hypothetical protein
VVKLAAAAAAAGLQRQVQEEPLCMLLEKLLMVQVGQHLIRNLRIVIVYDAVRSQHPYAGT